MYKLLSLVALFLHSCYCPRVIDRVSQTGSHIADYCVNNPPCIPGSHVMCMYYDPDRIMGPHCFEPQNVTMDTILANKIMSLLNAARGRLALGKEKGQNEQPLPKAYGMNKLEWDSELATFAQVLANQCVLMHDLCRATTKFRDPGQIIGSCNFRYPSWEPLSKTEYNSSNAMQSKLLHAMTAVVKSWYSRKDYVTAETILQYPDWSTASALPKIYLEMIYAKSTHVGCGISASTTYSYSKKAYVILNIVIVVCNLSSRPKHGEPVYNTNPPTEVGYTTQCGCPPGYDEDENCLCYENNEIDRSPPTSTSATTLAKYTTCNQKRCKPAMVVLPIFSVQDAPPEKLVPPSTFQRQPDSDIFELDSPFGNNSLVGHSSYLREATNLHSLIGNIKNSQQRISKPVKVFRDVEERRFDRKPIFPNVSKRLSITNHLLQYNSPKKTSLFSKVPIFDLSKRGDNTYKRSVLPRKDFSSVKNLVNDYINIRRNRFKSQGGFFSTPNYPTNQPNIKSERILNSAEEKVMKTNYYLSNKINSTVSEPILMPDSLSGLEYEKSDIKLMHLLNKLEQEVKHIELDEVKKEIFDAKIRKIYDSVVGPKDFLNRRITDPFETDIVGLEMNENLNTNQNLYSEYENNNHKAKKLHHKIDEFSHKQDNFATNYENSNFDITRENRPLMKNKNALLHNNENNKGNIFGLRRSDPGQEYEIVAKKNLPKNMFRENDILKQRKTYNSNINKLRDIYSNVDIKRRQDMVEKGALNHNDHDDLLSHERRKYYQTILENLERKLRESRNRHHKDHKDNKGRPLRPVRPTVRKEAPLRPLKSQLDPFYMADRARFLHGF